MPAVDKSLVRLKLHYLLHGMGGSPVVPFGSLVGRQLGVNPASMGVIFALMPCVGLVLKPLLGGIADKYGAKKRVLMLVILSAMVNYSLLPLLPSLPLQGSETPANTCDQSLNLEHEILRAGACENMATAFRIQDPLCLSAGSLTRFGGSALHHPDGKHQQ